LFLVGKASSRTAFVGSSWHGEHVREANVARKSAGTSPARRKPDKLTREDKMAMKGEIASLTELAELKKVIGAAKKVIFKYGLDEGIRQRQPDTLILVKQKYKIALAQKEIRKIMAEEEAKAAMQVKVPTYTEWMETNLDLEWMKSRTEIPAFRPRGRRPDLPLYREFVFKKRFAKKYGYQYEEPNAWEEYTAKGGDEWWKGQKQLKTEEKYAKEKAKKKEWTERNAAWKKLWAAEAEVRRQELGRT